MARLRLGDIEIDGNRIRIGGEDVTGNPPAPASSSTAMVVRAGGPIAPSTVGALAPRQRPGVPSTTSTDGIDSLAGLRIKSGWLVGGGGVVAAAGAASLVLSGWPTSIFDYFLHGTMFLPIGAGLVLMGILKTRADRHVAAQARARREAEVAPLLDKVRAALPTGDITGPTVEKLVEATGLPEADLVRALVTLRERGEVEEELDTSTGDWFYRLVADAQATPNSLDDRLARIEGDPSK